MLSSVLTIKATSHLYGVMNVAIHCALLDSNILCKAFKFELLCVETVSYTHLDVYKRQRYSRGLRQSVGRSNNSSLGLPNSIKSVQKE